jgi:predicted DNA-binding protein YlxM (UPF0122 family)
MERDMPSQELRFRVLKFIIVPICTVFNEFDDAIEEKQMKSVTHYVGNDINLRELAQKLEEKVNEQFLNKLKATSNE